MSWSSGAKSASGWASQSHAPSRKRAFQYLINRRHESRADTLALVFGANRQIVGHPAIESRGLGLARLFSYMVKYLREDTRGIPMERVER